jgi:hypothetical protein
MAEGTADIRKRREQANIVRENVDGLRKLFFLLQAS